MGDQLWLSHGCVPWRPAMGTELVDVFDKYDVPSMGLIEQGGNYFAFWCVEGLLDPYSVWGYTLLEDYEVDDLRRSEDVGTDFDRAFYALVTRRPTTLALMDEQLGGIVLWAQVAGTSHDELFSAFKRILRNASDELPAEVEMV